MNRIFKVLWNAATGTFIVTSETAKSRGKKSGRRKLAVSALVGLSSIMVSADALANAGNDTGSINQNTTDIATNTTSINNLTAGTLAADSTDAVNGSQLFDTNEKVDQNTADITTNTTSINNLSNSVTTLTDDALLWDAASGTFSASRNGSASKITNLAAGTLAADSTDAVNGSQLFDTNEKVDQNTADITTNTTSINNLSNSVTTLTDDALLWDAASGTFSASRNGSASKI
ncbi:ESPR-type extended signal peptide-containing protein, partial [Salmonella enterica]|uniref:ESPR-type extended signal peptide-containing protein n=1 Tax=Salmonella enterica TaxID=28901 RepID=UPI00223656AD